MINDKSIFNSFNIAPEIERLQFPTFLDALKHRAENTPNNLAYSFMSSNGCDEETLTYADIETLVTKIAKVIGNMSIISGNEQSATVLLLPQGKHFVAGFYACIASGSIAVATFPPKNKLQQERLKFILSELKNCLILTEKAYLSSLQNQFIHEVENDGVTWLTIEDCFTEAASKFSAFTAKPSNIAMLQYTYGSTSNPKGVIVSNQNLVENCQLIKECLGHQKDTSRSVFWLPPYHDMGLIGGVLEPLYVGFPAMLMPTEIFVRSQYSWLEAISKFKGTCSGGPNLAFELCINNVSDRQLENLDLSSWENAFCGSEPISYNTMSRFSTRFSRVGFDPEAIYPCYGMAETTLMVSGKQLGTLFKSISVNTELLGKNKIKLLPNSEQKSHQLVSSGHVHHSMDVRIVDPESNLEKNDGEVGEIWICGPSVTQGYWNDLEKTHQQFEQEIVDRPGKYFKTGDLGFIADSELFITGRMKEIIIVGGVNHYPQDLEYEASTAFQYFRNCRIVAFSVQEIGSETLIIVIETPRKNLDFLDISTDINRRLEEKFDVKAEKIIFVPRKTVKSTSSGKVQRVALKNDYLNGHLNNYFIWDQILPSETIEIESTHPSSLASKEHLSLEPN